MMKRGLFVRASLTVSLSMLLVVAAHVRVSAADQPMQFMTTDGSASQFTALFGDYDFNLYNRTNGWVLNGFYTQENGKWSRNWLSSKMKPGEWRHMVWSAASNEGACVVPFKTTWDDYDKPEIYKLDWCKGIKNVYLKDDTFTVDYK